MTVIKLPVFVDLLGGRYVVTGEQRVGREAQE